MNDEDSGGVRNNKKTVKETKMEKQGKKVRKTTYFFQPKNTLTNTEPVTTTPKTTSAEEVTFSKQPLAVPEVNTPTTISNRLQPSSSPQKSNSPLKVPQPESHNSDDSFDGIRWGVSPNKLRSKFQQQLPSSPLKENGKSSSNGGVHVTDQASILINEQTNSVLNKYGSSDFHNILILTPSLSRTYSENVPFVKSNTKVLPGLTRAKSTGVDMLKSSSLVSSGSTLNSWIDKFNSKQDDDDLAMSGTPEKSPGNDLLKPSNLKSEVENLEIKDTNFEEREKREPDLKVENCSDKIIVNVSDDEEDPFSDDDDDILLALGRDSSPTNGDPTGDEVGPANCTASDSDDPFTDDDSALLDVLGVPKEQGKPSVPLTPNIPILKSFSSKFNIKKDFATKSSYELSGEEPTENSSELSFSRPNLNRYQIKGILSRNYGNGMSKKQYILDVEDSNLVKQRIILRGEYTDLDIQVNDIVHVIVTNTANPRLIDDNNNLLIWNPDVLLSATTIANQITCSRKTVLLSRYKFPGELSVPLIVGEVTHRIFQECFVRENWKVSFMEALLDEYLEDYYLSIFSIGEEVIKVKEEILKHLPYLETWFNKYYRKPHSINNYIPTNKHNESIMFSANKALDIEENIWSPMFGVKGMVDVTLEARLENKTTSGQFLLPMEIKTGREYITHLAQATLYSLLFKDRYDMDITSFLLVYTKEQLTKKCDISQTDLKALVNLRNKVTKYFKENTRELPPLLQSSVCERCEVQAPCMTLNKLVEDGDGEHSGLPLEVYEDLVMHLNSNPKYREFYNHWDELLTLEEGVMKKTIKYLWTLTSSQRETQDGKALGGLRITESDDGEGSNSFLYKFERKSTDAPSILRSQLTKHDRVVVSDETGHFGIAYGTIQAITYSSITISTTRRIISSDMKLNNFNSLNNQLFQGVLHKLQLTGSQVSKSFRIDKNEMYLGMDLARFNILNLFLLDGDSARRRMVVELERPTFLSLKVILSDDDITGLNSNQIQAIEKVLSANDYSLILGMPGTGKTTVISRLIKILVKRGKTVLLASYTHSAVDNILLKLKDSGIDMLRLGRSASVHKDIRQYIPAIGEDKRITTYEEFLKTYLKPRVVATTCLGINDITFNVRKKFDYCIVDEASQVSMPISLGPLRFCDRFILVGDHNQLPPLVQHPRLDVKHELSQSLFKILAEAYPESVVELTYQYRMCSDIMELSNLLIYDNHLQCGSEAVANQSLVIPSLHNLLYYMSPNLKDSERWIDHALKDSNKVIFFDHDQIPAIERGGGSNIENPTEATLVTQIVNSLLATGVEEKNIGVMSFNRGQLRLLRRVLDDNDIEILTADQFQGRDKECIIISLVRSNEENKAGDLVKEWRRVNVAITRAKSKLIILGSKSTLSSAKTIRKFIELLDSRGWIYQLPSNALSLYNFEKLKLKSTPPTKRQRISTPKLIKNHQVLNDIMNDMIT
jgi:DNA replication ATP-dependent helicase Dna2